MKMTPFSCVLCARPVSAVVDDDCGAKVGLCRAHYLRYQSKECDDLNFRESLKKMKGGKV